MEERNSKSHDFEQGELVSQLREKVRTQAQRLRGLEQYRVLCEQRIQELQPGHNFPVRPEDLGTGVPSHPSQELQLAKQKISRLEHQLSQQSIKVPLAENYTFPSPSTSLTLAQLQELYSAIYYQHHDLIKEKNLVEESLRAEMLSCEEQRAYIEVLKQALESNLQELGMSGRTFEDALARHDHREGNQGEVSDLTEILKMKSDECNQMAQEREKTDQHLQEAAEALQYAEEEVQRLEEEKSALLDYIEEQARNNKEKTEELEKVVKEYNDMERKIQGVNSELVRKKELEKELENLKSESSRFDKDLESETQGLKNQIKALESKIESLQANNSTLAGTLKETQEELDSVKAMNDLSIKEVSSIRKNLSVKEMKIEEVERSWQKQIEDLENKLAKAEKEAKYKEKKLKDIESHSLSLQEQLANEIDDLKSELEKNAKNVQESLDLKKKLKKVTDDLSKYHSMSNESGQALMDLKKLYEVAQIDIQQGKFGQDKLQSDMQRLEFALNSERSSMALVQDENTALRERLEETSKSTKTIHDISREKENKLQNAAYEIENLKKSLSLSLADTENERALKSQYYEEMMRLKKLQTSLAHSGEQAEASKKLICEFSSNFGAVSAASNMYSSIISSQFKDMLFKCNEVENVALDEWVQCTCEELEALIRRLSEYKQDLTSMTQKLSMTQNKIDNLTIDESSLRDRERTMRGQVENLVSEKEKLQNDREMAFAKLQTSQNELGSLRKELQIAADEGQRLRDQLNYTTTETVQWRNTAETDIFAIRAFEEKSNLLLKEKKELETLLNKLQSAVPSNDLQRIFLDIMKCHGELEIINRERLRIESQLLRNEGEMRSFSRNHQQEKAIQLRREVESMRAQLCNCDSQIMSYKRRMLALDEEMQDVEKSERRRFAMHLDTEKGYVQLHSDLEFRTKELQHSQLSAYELKRKQEVPTEKKTSFASPQPMYAETYEDRPVLSYFDKLRRARNIVTDLKEQD